MAANLRDGTSAKRGRRPRGAVAFVCCANGNLAAPGHGRPVAAMPADRSGPLMRTSLTGSHWYVILLALFVPTITVPAMAGETARVGITCNEQEVNWSSNILVGFRRVISDNGRYVVFHSQASFGFPDDNNTLDVFLRDRDVNTNGVFDEPEWSCTFRIS